MPVACEYPDLEDWTRIQDAELRKRVQNRLSQRRHREKIRKQNGTAMTAISSRKTRSETASAPPGSSATSRSVSPQASSNTSAQSGTPGINEGPLIDSWEDQTEENLTLDADWNELTFLDNHTLDHDALFSFPRNSLTPKLPSYIFATRPHQQLSLPADGSRPCSCGAHAVKGWLGNTAARLSQYHTLGKPSHVSSPAPLPSMTLSETPTFRDPSPVHAHDSPQRAGDSSTPSTRDAPSVSVKAQRPKMLRMSTADSAIDLPTSEFTGGKENPLGSGSSRKRPRTENIDDFNTYPSSTEIMSTQSQDANRATSPSQPDDNTILQRVSEVLQELARDDVPSNKRQKQTAQEDPSPNEEKLAEGNLNEQMSSLPKIRRGTLPGGGQIIVIVVQPCKGRNH